MACWSRRTWGRALQIRRPQSPNSTPIPVGPLFSHDPVATVFNKRRYMKNQLMRGSIATAVAALFLSALPVHAQSPQVQQKLAEIKTAMAANKQALAHYTWQEQQTTSIKGDVKKQQVFQVSVGPDGQQQKTQIGGSQAAPPSGGRLKQHVVEKKTAEFQDYGESIAALAKQYTQPDPG